MRRPIIDITSSMIDHHGLSVHFPGHIEECAARSSSDALRWRGSHDAAKPDV
jgi:hypothetical protein